MSKKKIGFIGALFLGLLNILGAIITIREDTGINLKKADVIVGEVSNALITTRLVRGAKYNRTQTVFYFKLKNSDQNFTVYRSDQGYWILDDNIKKGDTIKVFYHASSAAFNLDVYQIEKKGKIIQDYQVYENQASTVSSVMLIAGILIILVSIIHYTKFNVWKFLLDLTR